VGASLSFALRALFIKLSGNNVSLWQLLFLQAVLGLPVLWLLAQSMRMSVKPSAGQAYAYAGRLVFGIANTLLLFLVLLLAPAGIATLLGCTAPLFLAMLAPVMLKERSSALMLVLVGLAFGGISIAASGATHAMTYAALAVGLGAGLAGAFAQVYSRRLALVEEPSLRIVFWLNVATAVVGAIGVTCEHGWSLNAAEYVAGFVIALCSVGGQALTSLAYSRGSALMVNAMSYLTLPFTAVLAWVGLNEQQSLEGWLGMAVTVAATSGLVFAEQRALRKLHRSDGAQPTAAQVREEEAALQEALGAEAQPLIDVHQVLSITEQHWLGEHKTVAPAEDADGTPEVSPVR
jgi:drug/metabolite transporter (DMT)-like permease